MKIETIKDPIIHIYISKMASMNALRFYKIGNVYFNPAYIKEIIIGNEYVTIIIANTRTSASPCNTFLDVIYEYNITTQKQEYSQVIKMAEELAKK